MVIEKEIEILNSIEHTWNVLGPDFAHPDKWASVVSRAEGRGHPIETSQYDERACQTTMGKMREKVTGYSDKDFRMSYQIEEGMPFFVTNATNDWQLTKLTPQKTKLKIKMKCGFKGIIGRLMQPMMKRQINKLGTVLVEDFAYYVENGKPHPRKLKAQKNEAG